MYLRSFLLLNGYNFRSLGLIWAVLASSGLFYPFSGYPLGYAALQAYVNLLKIFHICFKLSYYNCYPMYLTYLIITAILCTWLICITIIFSSLSLGLSQKGHGYKWYILIFQCTWAWAKMAMDTYDTYDVLYSTFIYIQGVRRFYSVGALEFIYTWYVDLYSRFAVDLLCRRVWDDHDTFFFNGFDAILFFRVFLRL